MAKELIKIIEIKLIYSDAVKRVGELTTAIKQQNDAIKKLKKDSEDYNQKLGEHKIQIAAATKERQGLIAAIRDENKIMAERAKQIDKEVNDEVKRITAYQKRTAAVESAAERQALIEGKLIQKEDELAKKREMQAARDSSLVESILQKRKLSSETQQNLLIKQAQKENESAAIKEQSELKKQNADKRSDILAAVSAQKKEGYINQLKISVNALEQEYYQLTEAELKSAKGTELLGSLKNKRAELMQLQQAYGNHQLNVGNYSSATKMLGINIGQVMKEMPNFAISARIGIMSLTNNLPMLAETLQQVRLEQVSAKKAQEGLTAAQLAAMPAGGKLPSMFSLISKSVFGLTGIMSIAMVLMQLFGGRLIEWAGNLFKAKNSVDELAKSLAELNKTSLEKSVSDSEKLRKFAIDYNKATKEGNKERIADLEEIAQKEYGVHSDRLTQIGQNVNTWRNAFKEYLQIAKDTYFNEALAKKRSELEVQKEILEAKKAEWKKAYQEESKAYGHIFSDEELENLFASGAGLFAKKQRKELIDEWNKTMTDIRSTNQIAYKNIYSDTNEVITQNTEDAQKAEWESFSKSFDARREAIKLEQELQKTQYDVLQKMQESFEQQKTDKAESEEQKRQKILIDATKKSQQALQRVLSEELQQSFKDVDAMVDNYMMQINAKISDADTRLATAQIKGNATTELQLKLLAEQETAEIMAAIKRGESITAIEEFYAAKRGEIKRTELEAILQSTASLFGSMSDMLEENTVAQKIASSAQALINTYLGATSAYAQTPGGVITKSLAAAAAVVAGLASVRKIWAVDTNVPKNSAASNANIEKKIVTEKFHTGGTNNAQTGVETPATLLGGESVNTIATTQMFSPLLSALNQLGGGKAITSGVANTGMGTDMLASAFSKALRNMPPNILIMEQFEKASDKYNKIQNNRIIK